MILSFTLLKIEQYLPGIGIKTWLTGSSRLHRDGRGAAVVNEDQVEKYNKRHKSACEDILGFNGKPQMFNTV